MSRNDLDDYSIGRGGGSVQLPVDEVRDIAFDSTQEIGINTAHGSESTLVVGVKEGILPFSEEGITNPDPVYVVAIGGTPVYDKTGIVLAIQTFRKESPSRTLIITFATRPLRPLPLWKPVWKLTLLLTTCVPSPDHNEMLTGANGKFLGRLEPAHRCNCCCRLVHMSLESAVCVLALLQISGSFSLLIFLLGADLSHDVATAIVDIGLAL